MLAGIGVDVVAASKSFPAEQSSARRSREFLRDMLTLWHADDLAQVAELVTGELVTNVVVHAVTNFDIDLEWDDPRLRVEIRDGSSVIPAVSDAATAEGGYGLRIVAALTREWGVAEGETGKSVWFTLERDQPSGS